MPRQKIKRKIRQSFKSRTRDEKWVYSCRIGRRVTELRAWDWMWERNERTV